jgi:fatty acid desaturase
MMGKLTTFAVFALDVKLFLAWMSRWLKSWLFMNGFFFCWRWLWLMWSNCQFLHAKGGLWLTVFACNSCLVGFARNCCLTGPFGWNV